MKCPGRLSKLQVSRVNWIGLEHHRWMLEWNPSFPIVNAGQEDMTVEGSILARRLTFVVAGGRALLLEIAVLIFATFNAQYVNLAT